MSAASPADARIGGLLVRAGLVVAAAAATAAQVPTIVRTPLSALALAAVLDLVIRRDPHGGRRAVALAVGGSLAGVLLVGLALNLAGGLDATGWAVGLGALGVATVAVRGRGPLRPLPRPELRSDGAWYAGAAVLVLAGLVLAVTVTERAERDPLQLWAEGSQRTGVTVSVSSPSLAGPFDLWLEDGRERTVIRSRFSLAARQRLDIPVPKYGDRQMRISLRNSGTKDDVRFVIVNPGEPESHQ